MNGAVDEVSNGHTREAPSEAEVQTIIQSIKEASSLASGPTSPPLPTTTTTTNTNTLLQNDLDQFDEGEYWDYSSMAPLNAASAVSSIVTSS